MVFPLVYTMVYLWITITLTHPLICEFFVAVFSEVWQREAEENHPVCQRWAEEIKASMCPTVPTQVCPIVLQWAL